MAEQRIRYERKEMIGLIKRALEREVDGFDASSDGVSVRIHDGSVATLDVTITREDSSL